MAKIESYLRVMYEIYIRYIYCILCGKCKKKNNKKPTHEIMDVVLVIRENIFNRISV